MTYVEGCPCGGLEGEELIRCLAPPPGEYEVHVSLPGRMKLVINSEGYVLRAVVADESLPFLRTLDRHVDQDDVAQLLGDSLQDALCTVINSLEEAAAHGSEYSRRLLDGCRQTVDSIKALCKDNTPGQ